MMLLPARRVRRPVISSFPAAQLLTLFRTGETYNASLNKLIIVKGYSMIDFTSRQLRAFLLVAQYRSFSRAAAALFITPSGLSLLIRELETQLGVRLFDRTTRHVALTNSGTELLVVAQRNLQELEGTMSRIGQSTSAPAPRLSLGTPMFWASSVFAQAIKEFRSRQPDFRFEMFDADTAAIMQRVEAGTLDMGLGFFFKHLTGIRQTPLFRFSLMVIRADDAPKPRRAATSWSALKAEKIIALQPQIPLQQFIDKHLSRAGIVCEPTLVVNYLNTQIAMVEAGEGIAIVPSFALPECRKRGLQTSRLTNPAVHLDLCQIRKGGNTLPPVAEEFTSFLRTYIGSWAGRSGVL
jgi:LysR family transcriptional regulator, carnitine catabolism transcriptional activator